MTTLPNSPVGTLASGALASARSSQRVREVTLAHEMSWLEPQWRLLAERNGSPMQRYQWAAATATTFAEPGTLRIEAILRDEDVVAIAPLVARPHNGVTHNMLLGVSELHEPSDFIYRDADALDDLVQVLLDRGTPLMLGRVPADSPTRAALKRIPRHRAIVLERPHVTYPYISLDESWHEPESHLNSGRRSDLRRARRKAEDRGPVTVQIIRPKFDELDQLLDKAFAIEASSWKGDTKTALVFDPKRADFFRNYARAACADGTLRLCFLNISERAVAMQFAIECGGGFWLLKIGYDQEFSHCSPGQLLMRETIKYAVETGLSSYEFLGTAAPWTQVWTKHEKQSVSLCVYPTGVTGMTALAIRATRALRHKWTRK